MHPRRSWPVVALALLLAASTAWAGSTDLRVVRNRVFRALQNEPNNEILDGASVVPPVATAAAGAAVLSADTDANVMGYDITENVAGETAAHVHGPAYGFENGPVLYTLPVGSHKVGNWNMDSLEESYLLAGQLYIDVHSTAFPGGEIRGQVQCQNPPVAGRSVDVRVVVQNLGPDAYNGIDTAGRTATNAVNKLQVSVDIDEPTKPGLGDPRTAIAVLKEFRVSLAPMDSVELDLGVINYFPPAGVSAVRSTSTAQGVNVDPDPTNDTRQTTFTVLPTATGGSVPAAGLVALAAAAAGLAGIGGRALRRRRFGRPPGAGGGGA